MVRPLRVLRTVPSYFPYVTGPANQVRQISKRLAVHGVLSKVVTTNLMAGDRPINEYLDGVEVARLPIKTGVMQYHVVAGAWRELLGEDPDVIHAHSYRHYLTDVAACVAQWRHKPLILQPHGALQGYRHIVKGRRRWIYRLYDLGGAVIPLRWADGVVVATRQEAHEAVVFGVPEDRIAVIPVGIDVEEYVFPLAPKDRELILCVARLSPDRRVEVLLQALAKLPRRDWRCVIVGGEERRSYASGRGYLGHLRRLTAELGLVERVEFAGPKYGEELRRTYATAGIFAYTSRYENFGQTVLEAAAAGCAIVSTPVGVARDLVEPGVSGYLTPHDDVASLARYIDLLLSDPSHQASVGQQARKRVAAGYSWAAVIAAYLRLYEGLL